MTQAINPTTRKIKERGLQVQDQIEKFIETLSQNSKLKES